MARNKTVELTMVSGAKYYVPAEEFNSANIPESPDSVIGNYIRGRRGPMLKVNTLEDMSGEQLYVNPQLIESMKVTYS